ncbi:hypothetical protein [Cellulosilyticum sp. I15G10I2]|uniref:hypothetical protein n=1 Tax=Cellulosilyticum sp. I15G10I2 TaxID=1892843 RepID=UPI00085BFF7E|nr:hypothetical protein [Cellulosilyticum sp. I15G10I2]
MDDSRIFAGNTLWIWILLAFLLFSNYGRGGAGVGGIFGGGGLECAFPNLFGCGGNTWMWIIIAVLAYMLLAGDGCGAGIFRNEIQ